MFWVVQMHPPPANRPCLHLLGAVLKDWLFHRILEISTYDESYILVAHNYNISEKIEDNI